MIGPILPSLEGILFFLFLVMVSILVFYGSFFLLVVSISSYLKIKKAWHLLGILPFIIIASWLTYVIA